MAKRFRSTTVGTDKVADYVISLAPADAGLDPSLGVQPVGGLSAIVRPTMAVDTLAYAPLDIIGGELTLPAAVRTAGGTGILHSLAITDDDNERAAFDVLLFNAALAGTKADQGPLVHAAADPAKFLGRIVVLAADYVTVVAGSLAVASLRNIGLPIKAAAGSTSLFALVIATGAPTFTATSDLKLAFGILWD